MLNFRTLTRRWLPQNLKKSFQQLLLGYDSYAPSFSSAGEDMMLRRHDYSVNVAGGFPAAQLTSCYIEADGIRLPSIRRAYTRGPDRRPITDMLMVSIDFSEVAFT